MSCAYADLGMHELAAAAAKEALRVNPNSWMALANIGYTESMRGKYVELSSINTKLCGATPTRREHIKSAGVLGGTTFKPTNTRGVEIHDQPSA